MPSTDARDDGLLEVGRILRAHGLRGDVVVDFSSDRPERRQPGSILQSSVGALEVEQASAFQGRWRVRFGGVADRTAAERLRGVVLFAVPIEGDDEELWVHQLIGAEVVDTTGRRLGAVESVEANPASDLLVLDGGGLVPVVFVVGHEPGRVVVDPPAGLLDEEPVPDPKD